MTTTPPITASHFVKRPSFIFSLAALTALTATAIDVALPAQPAIAVSFGERPAAGGIIVSAYFLGFGPGQLVWGPLADKYGRMPPMIIGLIGFIITTILCIYATSLEMLALIRVFQGIFGGSTPVIARAIARDQGGGKDTANLLATILMIFGLAPLLAPIIGSGILMYTDWTGIFWFLVVFGLTLMILAQVFIAPATKAHAAIASTQTPMSRALVWRLLSQRDFAMGTAAMAVLFAGYSTILASGAAMAEEHYGLNAIQFGPLFAVAASAAIIGPAISKRIMKTGKMRLSLKFGSMCCGLAGIAFFVMAQTYVPLAVYWGFVFLYVLGYGIMLPVANAIALEPAGDAAGTASSLLSALPTSAGILGAALATSTLFPSAYEALSYCLACGGVIAFMIVFRFGRSPKPSASDT